jgi:hypothetical protein
MAPRASSKTRKARSSSPRRRVPGGYLEQTQRPLNCLAFLMPLLIVYEIGIFLAYPPLSGRQPPEVMAKYLLEWFMTLFGVTGFYLPGLMVVVALLGWHVWRKDKWQVDRPVLLGMGIESVVLAVPPLLYHALLASSTAPASPDWADSVLLSMSAGIYEELVFRLLLINLLTFLLADVANLKRGPAEAVAVILSSLLFAAHHCQGFGGAEPFEMATFVFRAIAGLYLSIVFALRGFGIAVGCHTIYDVIVVTIR